MNWLLPPMYYTFSNTMAIHECDHRPNSWHTLNPDERHRRTLWALQTLGSAQDVVANWDNMPWWIMTRGFHKYKLTSLVLPTMETPCSKAFLPRKD